MVYEHSVSTKTFNVCFRMIAMKKILITGGAGFLGVNVTKVLLGQGNKVFAVDNFYSSSRENIEQFAEDEKYTFIEQDINHQLDIAVDEIYHLGCPASPVFYQKDHLYTLETCYIGTKNMLELASKNNARILFTSTSEVYGDPEVHPQKESYVGHVNPIGPRSCYDEGKRVAESLCVNYHLERGVDLRIVRIFNTYGPYMHATDGRVMSNFIMAAMNSAPLEMHANGEQTRSFCYVDDLVRGLIGVMGLSQFAGPINLGNPHEVTIRELAELILANLDSQSELKTYPRRDDDPLRRKPDISKAKELLSWEPSVCLEEGVKKTIAYFQQVEEEARSCVTA